MKKHLALWTLLLLTCQLTAQVTITAADMPSSGDIYTYSTTQDFWNLNPGNSAGPNQIWDFTFLSPENQRRDTFVTVSSTPLAYQFFFNNPFLYADYLSDHALRLPIGGGPQGGGPVSISNAFSYYRIDSTAYIQTGFGARINNVPSSEQYDPRDFIYRFPMNFGNTDASTAKYLVSVPTLGAYGQTIDRSNLVDGWGTLITPLGTFQALRLKTTIVNTDTFYFDQVGFGTSFQRPPTTEYHWLAPGMGTPLLSITQIAQGPGPASNFITYQDTLQPVSVSEAISHASTAFPNPALDRIRITGLQHTDLTPAQVRFFNAAGQSLDLRMDLESNGMLIHRDELPAGIYFVEIRQGNVLHRHKLCFRD